MENASKALIIAGAILLSILIISFGIIVINNVRGTITNANVDETEIQAFNSKFQAYVGGGKSASQIEQLIQAVMTSNMQENNSKSNRFIQVQYQGGGIANASYGATGTFSKINSIPVIPGTKFYNVTATYRDNGLIAILTVK